MRRRLKRTAIVVAIAFGVLVLALLAVLGLAPVRTALLAQVIARVDAELPGALEVSHASWPRLGRLVLEDISWTDGDTLLARVDRLALDVELAPLLSKEIHVRSLEFDVASANVPRILARFPAADRKAEPPPTSTGGGFPRTGAIPGVPAIAVDRLSVALHRLVVTDTLVVETFTLDAHADLIDAGSLTVDALEAEVHGPDVRFTRGEFFIDLGRGTAGGELLVTEEIGGTALALRFAPKERDRFAVTLSGSEARATDAPGLTLDVRLARDGEGIAGVDVAFEGRTPSTTALASHPLLADALASVPPLSGLGMSGELSVRARDALDASLALDLAPGDWLEGGRVRAAVQGSTARLDTLVILLPGARVDARAETDGEVLDASASLDVRAPALVEIFAPDAPPLDSLRVRVDARARGDLHRPAVEVRTTASLRSGDLTLDRAVIAARTEGAGAEPVFVGVDAAALGFLLSADARVETGDAISVALTPVRVDIESPVRTPAEERRPSRQAYGGTVSITPGGDVTLSKLEVLGDLGRIDVAGTLPAGGEGTLTARWSANGLPPGIAYLADIADSVRAALDASLGGDAPYTIDVVARLAAAGVALDAKVRLPGPETLAPLLPPGADLSGFGALTGNVSVRSVTGDAPSTRVAATLSAPGWLSALTARIEQTGTRTRVDTLGVVMSGLALAGAGVLDGTASDLVLTLDLQHLDLARRLVPALPPDLDASLAARAHLTGAVSAPAVRVSATGAVDGSQVAAPAFRAEGTLDRDGLVATVEVSEGLRTPSVTLDVATLHYSAPAGSLLVLPGTLGVEVSGPGLAALARARIERTQTNTGAEATTVTADTLALVLDAYDVRSAGPFSVSLAPERIQVDGLRLAGGLGTLEASGALVPGASDLRASADLSLPPPPAALQIPQGLWPTDVRMTARALGDSARVTVDVGGFEDEGRDVRLHAEAFAAPSGVDLALQVADRVRALVSVDAALPIGVAIFPVELVALGDSLAADVRIDGLTVPVRGSGSFFRDEPRSARIDGRAHLRGTAGKPSLDAELHVGFPSWPEMAALALDITGELSERGVDARVRLTSGQQNLLTGRAEVPMDVALFPGRVELSDAPISARLEAKALDLSRLAPLLPADQNIGGTCTLDLAASGDLLDPTIEGRARAPRVSIELADGSRVACKMDVRVSGTGKRPVVRGTVDVASGAIIIPEIPQNLHPTAGQAALWETELASTPGEPDSTIGPLADATPAAAPISPDVDVRVVIDRGFWIRGQQLEVELAGDVRIKQSGITPTVVGELEAIRGQLELLGRRLTVERGVVSFYGEDELDPVLDISLTTRIDATLVRVVVGGTATAPELTLSSEPEMTDGDILSFLVLGRRLDELSDDQTGLLAQRATDVAAQLGAARVQAALGGRLGVDIISIQQGSGPEAQESLVVGKYLTEKILVKYEQALEGGAGFLVNLEYQLTRHLRVETLSGEGRSGAEVNWTNDY